MPLYFFCCYIINLYLVWQYSAYADLSNLWSQVFVTIVALTYPLIYLIPLILLTIFFRRAIHFFRPVDAFFTIMIVILSSVLTIAIYADLRLYDLYSFHINAFVINLLVTPGGIESMGGGTNVYISIAFGIMAIFSVHFLAFFIASALNHRLKPSKPILIAIIATFTLLTFSDRVIYGISDVKQYAPVLTAASIIPLYNHVTFRGFTKKIGIEPATRNSIKLEGSGRALNYPQQAIVAELPQKPLNIIWLVSESLRWDMLSPEIMPNTFAESRHGWRYTKHYSGGNGTRQGLFSLFYGIYGSYWDSFLMANRPPILLDLLQEHDYQLEMFTSADFTYPEFDQTLFASVPQSQLHQVDYSFPPWKRDEINTTKITQFLKDRDTSEPFMVFMFYESTHARYDFPKENALRSPYLEDLNYATMTRKSLASRIGELKNRYINASHHIDSELAKIYATLDELDLWQNTIVMVTGDHGEEFMENGFWGHNSGFSEQQIRTPMVLWLPGEKGMVVNKPTSHMDIIPTLLPLLGVKNSVADYSLGQSMADMDNPHNIVVSDWAGVAYIGDNYKFTMPFNSSLSSTNQLFTKKDKPEADIVSFLSDHRKDLDQILINSRGFTAD